jgi:hypothetical protein
VRITGVGVRECVCVRKRERERKLRWAMRTEDMVFVLQAGGRLRTFRPQIPLAAMSNRKRI